MSELAVPKPTELALIEELELERRKADARYDVAKRAKLSDEDLLPFARARLDAWREWGLELGDAEHGGDRRSDQVTSGDLKRADISARERARKIALVPSEDFEAYKQTDDPDKLTIAGLTRTARIPRSPEPLQLPSGVFQIVYADPPWRYEHAPTESRAIENQYPTLDLDEIKALGPDLPVAEDAVLFMWATNPKLTEAQQVLESWDFSYRTNMVWVKDKIGMGYYARQQHELLLVATRGKPGAPAETALRSSVVNAPRGRHSEKPLLFYELIEALYPGFAYLELFARSIRPGWASWGNELAA